MNHKSDMRLDDIGSELVQQSLDRYEHRKNVFPFPCQ